VWGQCVVSMGASVSVDVSFTVSIVVGVSVSVVVSDNIWVRVRVRVRVGVASTESDLLHWWQQRVDKNATRGQCLSALAHPFLKFREGIGGGFGLQPVAAGFGRECG